MTDPCFNTTDEQAKTKFKTGVQVVKKVSRIYKESVRVIILMHFILCSQTLIGWSQLRQPVVLQ